MTPTPHPTHTHTRNAGARRVERDPTYDAANFWMRLPVLLALVMLLLIVLDAAANAQGGSICTTSGGARTEATTLDDDASFLVLNDGCPSSEVYERIEWATMLVLSGRVTTHATDCTGVTATSPALCYERDADALYFCQQAAGTVCDSAGEWTEIAGGGGGTPGGADQEVLFNDGGSDFGGDPGLSFDKISDVLNVGSEVRAAYYSSVSDPGNDYLDFAGSCPVVREDNTAAGEFCDTATTLPDQDRGDISIATGTWSVDADSVALGTDTTGNYAGSASEGGAATTATALAANGANCSSGSYPLGVDASGAVESCAADDDVPDAGEVDDTALAAGAVDGGNLGEIADGSVTADDLGTDSVSADELNATGVESELEAVLDVGQLQGGLAADQVDTITDIAAALKTGLDLTLVTGTAGSTNDCAKWDANGDLVSAGAACGTSSGGITDVAMQVKTAGSGTYTPTSGMVQVLVICTAGGGGSAAETVADAAVSGGGAGGTAIGLFSAATIGASKPYDVAAASSTTGNSTTFGTAGALINCTGGAAGTSTGNTTTVGVGARGGEGGTCTGGDIQMKGGAGTRGTVYSTSNAEGGTGGSSFWGGGGRGGSATGADGGEAASAYGSGAGGGETSNGTDLNATNGGAGICYFIEYLQ